MRVSRAFVRGPAIISGLETGFIIHGRFYYSLGGFGASSV